LDKTNALRSSGKRGKLPRPSPPVPRADLHLHHPSSRSVYLQRNRGIQGIPDPKWGSRADCDVVYARFGLRLSGLKDSLAANGMLPEQERGLRREPGGEVEIHRHRCSEGLQVEGDTADSLFSLATAGCNLKIALPGEVLEIDKFVRTLDLTNNRIAEIPMEISKLNNMQRLVLAQNLLEHLPSSLGNLHSLKVLTLDANQLRTLPNELGFLVRLEQLSIMGNFLTCLPESLGNLKNLRLLNVSGNKLKSLPQTIGNCIALEEVRANVSIFLSSNLVMAADNSVEELPSSICSLIYLKSLSLDNNRLHQLPSRLLKDCKALQNISLHENPISMDQFQEASSPLSISWTSPSMSYRIYFCFVTHFPPHPHLQMEGFQEFEARRKKKFDKQIDSNVMMGSRALDEGLDL
ncbi:hypothetical protein Taro_038301, partial [Colocasia esculenta]|nr:hypothetical protein [Colocasia esculenta]